MLIRNAATLDSKRFRYRLLKMPTSAVSRPFSISSTSASGLFVGFQIVWSQGETLNRLHNKELIDPVVGVLKVVTVGLEFALREANLLAGDRRLGVAWRMKRRVRRMTTSSRRLKSAIPGTSCRPSRRARRK